MALVTDADGRPNNAAYFWLTGALSSFLDNVPTYLVFFELAGGNARELMGYVPGKEYLAATLAAISSGAVFMGANTYIGNAPNFMVYAIAAGHGRAHALLLRLHAVVRRHPLADLPAGDLRVLRLKRRNAGLRRPALIPYNGFDRDPAVCGELGVSRPYPAVHRDPNGSMPATIRFEP